MAIKAIKSNTTINNRRGIFEREKAQNDNTYNKAIDTMRLESTLNILNHFNICETLSLEVIKNCIGGKRYFNKELMAKYNVDTWNVYEARIKYKTVSAKIYINENNDNRVVIEVYGLYQYQKNGKRNITSVLKRLLLSELIKMSKDVLTVTSFDIAFDIRTSMVDYLKSDKLLAFTNPREKGKGKNAYVYEYEKGIINSLDDIESIYLQKYRKGLTNKTVVYDKAVKNNLDTNIIRIEKTVKAQLSIDTSRKLLEECLQLGDI
ncbi:hypothetical protein [Sulfurimonas sp.]